MNLYVRSFVQGGVIGLFTTAVGRVVTDPWLLFAAVAVASVIIIVISIRFFPEKGSKSG
jgi:hypothetical protein